MSNYLKERQAIKLGLHPTSSQLKREEKPKGIAKVSEKRKVVNRVYKKIVKDMALANNQCEIKSPECTGLMQGADHIQKRSPGNLTDRKNLKRACNACNLFKELNPQWAIDNGHSKSRFTK